VDRRRFLLTWLAGVLTAPLAAEAQGTGNLPRIEVLGIIAPEIHQTFEDSLSRLGYLKGRDVIIERRQPADGTVERFAESASEVAGSKPDVIVVWGTVGTVAVKKTGTALPVVFLSVGVPVEIGLISSLSHPGGNMTGVTFEAGTETYAKRLQLLREVVPRLNRVAVVYAAGDRNVNHAIRAIEAAALPLGIQVQHAEVRGAGDLEPTFSAIKSRGAQGVVVVAGVFTYTHGRKIAELALANRLPSSHAFRETAAAGGLISLGPDFREIASQGAGYVAKILKGAKPSDLPIEQPTKFELVINIKTAKTLGLTIPPSLLLRADQVIE
jgi:putative ABC transport system substrate-binding protein